MLQQCSAGQECSVQTTSQTPRTDWTNSRQPTHRLTDTFSLTIPDRDRLRLADKFADRLADKLSDRLPDRVATPRFEIFHSRFQIPSFFSPLHLILIFCDSALTFFVFRHLTFVGESLASRVSTARAVGSSRSVLLSALAIRIHRVTADTYQESLDRI